MTGAFSIVAHSGIVVDGKAADPMVVETMRASGVIDPFHGVVQSSLSPVVAYFPADGHTTDDVVAALTHVIESVLPTNEHLVSVNL